MSAFTKIAVTVPTDTYTAVERMRRRLGKSRSAAVALALEQWASTDDAEGTQKADQRYVDGYLRIPEAVDEIRAVAAQATSQWEPWLPDAPAVVRKRRLPAKKHQRQRR